MARVQASSKANGDTALTSSAEGSVSTNHDTGSSQSIAGKRHEDTFVKNLPLSRSANDDEAENSTSTGVTKEPVVWSHGLTSHRRRTPNPEDDDDAEYIVQDEEGVEIGAPDTSRSKSGRISEQSKRAKLTPEAV
jgi:hypothetical protein